MKKLIIVGTKAASGKGGISTALVGYISGLEAKGVDFDIVESHGSSSNILFSWFSSAKSVIRLAIEHRENAVFWFHCGPWLSLIRKSSLAALVRIFGCEAIGHIHSPTFNTYLNKSVFSRFLVKSSLKPFNKLIVLTPWWLNLLRSNGIKKEMVISANPNNQEYCQIAKESLRQDSTVKSKETVHIVTMSRLVEGKGVDLVIKALANLPKNFKLTIAGSGPLAEKFESLTKTLNLSDRVTFTGWINGSQKESLLRAADLFCLPSTYDSFGMVFIEAMAFNVPVVAYGWGPIKDVVTEDVGECCVNSQAEDVQAAIENVASQLESYANKGPKRVLTLYTPEIVSENIVALLK